jgi:hypothetical protein
MNRDGAKPDIAIGEVQTNLEIVDTAAPSAAQLRKIVTALVKQCLREENDHANLREQDTRITDRAWRPDLNRW